MARQKPILRAPLRFTTGDHFAPVIGIGGFDREKAALEAERQLVAQPFVEPLAAAAVRKGALDHLAELRLGLGDGPGLGARGVILGF